MHTALLKKQKDSHIIKKAAQLFLAYDYHHDGACIEVSLAFKYYFSKHLNIELSICYGNIITEDKCVPHTWLAYGDKYIDLTSHKQYDGVWVRPAILKEKSEYRIETDDLPDYFMEGFNDTNAIEEWSKWMDSFLDRALDINNTKNLIVFT